MTPEQYDPAQYLHTIEEKKIPKNTYKVYEIDLEDSHGAEVTLQIGENSDIALVDTGAYCSCMSEESYHLHNTAPQGLYAI